MLPNLLSFARIPLAFFLLAPVLWVRFMVIIAAWVTDMLDGALARRNQQETALGVLLDPMADKCFVFFALFLFWQEGALPWYGVFVFLLRDVSIILFYVYLRWTGQWSQYTIRPFFTGKLVTALQFITLLYLVWSKEMPQTCFWLLIILGSVSFVELFVRNRVKG